MAALAALRRVMRLAKSLGITRLADIQGLDDLGVAVVVAVRPTALPGCNCVTSGKGLTRSSATIGAIMEAAEYYWSEPQRHRQRMRLGTARDLEDAGVHIQRPSSFALPVKTFNPDAQVLAWLPADEIVSGQRAWVPAELVLFPDIELPALGLAAVGGGLAAAWSWDDAVSHGIEELLEQDARALYVLRGCLAPNIRAADLMVQPHLGALLSRAKARGLVVAFHDLTTNIGAPCISCTLLDPSADKAWFTNAGHACRLQPEDAALSAFLEAVQGRLGYMQGARDDLEERIGLDSEVTPLQFMALQPGLFESPLGERSLQSCGGYQGRRLQRLLDLPSHAGHDECLVVRLSPPDDESCVVRVLIPGLQPLLRGAVRLTRRGLAAAMSAGGLEAR
jgi:YcaO-like protein with predicted kinase domain